MRTKKLVAPVLLIVLFITVLIQLPLAIAQRTEGYDFIDPILDIRSILTENFVREPDQDAMQLAAINAMIETLGDQHTVFIPPAKERDFNKDLRGMYVGIGSEVQGWPTGDYEYLTIISPMDDSPSLESGVKAGDIVLEIEGESTFHMPVQDCIDRLLGEPNTQVTIKVRHLDETEEDLTITRRRIVARTVKGLVRNGEFWHHCVDPETNIAYVRVTQFNGSTIHELRNTLARLVKGGMKGLILDLRNNPGGALPVAIEMADMFLEEGDILSVKPRQGKGRDRTWRAHKQGTLPRFPMIVMVNGNSASASEIVSGALQDNGRAKVLGTRTFGKGSVQEVRELDFNRGTLKYTNAYYYLPSGRNLNRDEDSEMWGVDPDPGLVVSITDEEFGDYLRARRPFEIIKDHDDSIAECIDDEWIRENITDEQLTLAIEVLANYVITEEWMAVSDEDPTMAALDLETRRLTRARDRMIKRIEEIDGIIAERLDLTASKGKEPLLPEDIELNESTLTLRDAEGNVIGTYLMKEDSEVALNSLLLQLTPVKKEE